jgi:hypothetical protein
MLTYPTSLGISREYVEVKWPHVFQQSSIQKATSLLVSLPERFMFPPELQISSGQLDPLFPFTSNLASICGKLDLSHGGTYCAICRAYLGRDIPIAHLSDVQRTWLRTMGILSFPVLSPLSPTIFVSCTPLLLCSSYHLWYSCI